MSDDQHDLFEARKARDEGMEKVDRPSFTERVIGVVTALPFGSEWTGEGIRIRCTDLGVTPHHPNAWGAAVNVVVRKGLLIKTGEYRQMKRVSSHARVNPVYVRSGGV